MSVRSTTLQEVPSGGGVILGLPFVGYELRQRNSMARIEANTSAGRRWVDWNIPVAAEPELRGILARVVEQDLGRDDLTPGESMQAYLMVRAAVQGWETGYLNSLESTGGPIRLPEGGILSSRFTRESWPSLREELNSDFVERYERRYGWPETVV